MEWRQSIQIFVDANCKYFNDIKDFSHLHHYIWKNFQEIVENILQMALLKVGGSFDKLEKAIDHIKNKPSSGPRDEMIKEILHKLVTVADFDKFSIMMRRYNKAITKIKNQSRSEEVEKEEDENKFHLLINLGFSVDIINQVCSKIDISQTPIEDLVMKLSEIQSKVFEENKNSFEDKIFLEEKNKVYEIMNNINNYNKSLFHNI
jgi:Holliday junction resolvasome RuvABC DNA-binding subunit